MTTEPITLRTAFSLYYSPHRSIRNTTLKRYDYDLNRWEKYTENPNVKDITQQTLVDFRNAIQHLSPNTVNPNLKTVRYILEACLKRNIIDALPDPCAPLPGKPPNPSPIEFEHLEQFLRHVSVAKWPLDPDYWRRFIGFAYLTGLRRGDLAQVRKADCTRSGIRVVASKTGKAHRYPMPDWLWALIETAPDGRLFPLSQRQLYREMKRICAAAGVPYFSPQDIRILSANQWETARPQCGAVIQGSKIPGWSEATLFYIDPASLLDRGIDNLRVPEPLLSPEQRAARTDSRQKWDRVFEILPEKSREQLLSLAGSLAKIED